MSPVFDPRTMAPGLDSKFWIHWMSGGVNECMRISGNSVLPNCVGYAWGRWFELLGERPKLSLGNAENWWAKADGYARGKAPRLGAIACWSKGKAGYPADGAGHVSVVEDILYDETIITSNSSYLGNRFYMRKITPPYNIGSDFIFQGFIYPPVFFTFKTQIPLKSNAQIAEEVIQGKWGNGADRNSRLIIAGYNSQTIQDLVNERLNTKATPKKTVDEIAKEVVAGKWGTGVGRKAALTKAGYNYTEVQSRVNQLLRMKITKKPIELIAREVIRGIWGNGLARKKALINAGYDYEAVQAKVEQLLK